VTPIDTPRLLLRRVGPPDRPWLRELLVDEAVRRTTLRPVESPLRAWASAWVMVLQGARCDTVWAVEERRTRTPAGLDPSRPPATGPRWASQIRRHFWNRGFATEAAIALAEQWLARPEHECIEGLVFTGNRASQRVFEKAGFTSMGACLCEGHPGFRYERRRPAGTAQSSVL
jgi:RimJ/RimL family protein N-acetyltransferase